MEPIKANEIIAGFEQLIETAKKHRAKLDSHLELHHLETIGQLTRLREERDVAYQKEHNELIAHVKKYQEQLEEKEERLEKIFKTVCASCSDRMRALLYS